jgi:hypothetical protein
VAYVFVTLSLLPSSQSTHTLKTTFQKLATKYEDIKGDEAGWVLPDCISGLDKSQKWAEYIILNLICNYLIANPNQFELIFAEISFAKSGCPDWIKPRKCAYSYLDTGHLAILAVCSEKDISGLPLDVDVSGVNMGKIASFILSDQLFLKNIILPGLIGLYQNCSDKDFCYEGKEYKNNRDLSMYQIKSGAIYYTPIVYKNKNIVRIKSESVEVTYQGNCYLYVNIYMYWSGDVKLNVVLQEGSLYFYPENPEFHHNEDIPWYWKWLSPVVGIIVKIVVSAISSDLARNIGNNIRNTSVGDMDSVSWFGKSGIPLASAKICESLVLEYK